MYWNETEVELDPEIFPDGFVDHNYCRNPDRLQSKPWCFVEREVEEVDSAGFVDVSATLEPQKCYISKCLSLS